MVKRMEAFIKTSPIRAGPRPLWFEEITGIIHMHPLVRLHYWNQDASLRLLMQFLLLPHEFIHYLLRLIYANKENWVQEWHHRLIYQFSAFLPLNIIFGLILFIPAFTRPKLFAREEGKRGQTPFSLEGDANDTTRVAAKEVIVADENDIHILSTKDSGRRREIPGHRDYNQQRR